MHRRFPLLALIVLVCSVSVHAEPTAALSDDGFALTVSPQGGFEVQVGPDTWSIDSSYSYPGNTIGEHLLTNVTGTDTKQWRPIIHPDGKDAITIEASGSPYYSLSRTIKLHHGRIEISDKLTNTGKADVGILIKHTIRTGNLSAPTLICGVAEKNGNISANPTIFATAQNSRIGAVAEDNIFRIQFEAAADTNQVTLSLNHLALKPGASVTLDWAMYAYPASADYWTFINQVRRDWDVNYTVPGPAEMLIVTREPYWTIFHDPEKLRAFLKRNALKMILPSPWLDYENMNDRTGKPVSRAEFKELMQETQKELKAADPEFKLSGNIEGPFVSPSEGLMQALLAVVPADTASGYHEMTPQMMSIMSAHPDAWKQWGDSLVWTKTGRPQFELYVRSGQRRIALTVRPVLGNGQDKYLLNQAHFILEDVGLDGLYVDSFAGAKHWLYGYSYNNWDGITVDIDPDNGKIINRYTDLALAGAGSRKGLMEYVIKQGKFIVTNDYPVVRDTQAVRAIHFTEADSAFDKLDWPEGQEPPASELISSGQLSTPVLLGIRPSKYPHGEENYSHTVMKAAIALLRGGMLYYHYITDIPETGPGNGEYGPFNHMFPITPVELHEGWIIGKERIVTAVSGNYAWAHADKPRVLVFDMSGRAVPADVQVEQDSQGWRVHLHIRDWASIGVIE